MAVESKPLFHPVVLRQQVRSFTLPDQTRSIQKLLDRKMFCAFCEHRGPLPAESYEHRDSSNPRPVWLNFRGLFRAFDEGNAGLNIPACNGGLFTADPAPDARQVPDEVCTHSKDLGDCDSHQLYVKMPDR